MSDIISNEREFTSQVISWLNEFLRDGDYPFEAASSEHSLKISENETRFPDVQLWLNRQTSRGFCGWELKTPATAVDDKELLNVSARKAQAMHADYFVTCNMRDAVIWRTPLTADVSKELRYKTYPEIVQISTPDDLWVIPRQQLLKSRIKEILYDLSAIFRVGHLHLIDVDSTFFIHELSEAVKAIRPHVHKSLETEVGNNAAFNKVLFAWAAKQGIEVYEAGLTFYETVSGQIVYRLLGKILFYLTLRRFRSDIPKLILTGTNPLDVDRELKRYFEIARQIDYQAVFEEDFPDKVPFPQKGIEPLVNLIEALNRYNFSQMPHDVVGNVFERLIPPEERHTLGQYYTNEELVDFITAFCVRTRSDTVLDPTCGTGTFLIRAYDRLRNFGERDHRKLLSLIWGIDVAHFPAELAAINLYRQKIEDYANFPRIISRDFFFVKPSETFKFPPPKKPHGTDFTIDENIPQFDAIVGNFPYIRQELIEKRIEGYKDSLESALFCDWSNDYPELFRSGKLKLSSKADIYAYLFFHAARHLKEGGRMGIVTSNSWLDVAYGYELQRFFLRKFKVIAILESRCEPWFEDASINTVITILERCEDGAIRDDNKVNFVKINKRLKELFPWDKNFPVDLWHGIDALIYTIETSGIGRDKYHAVKLVKHSDGSTTYEDNNFKIKAIKQSQLLKDVEEAGKTVKWGKYLRAPAVYFEIMDNCKDKLVPLRELADIKSGYKSGVNDFFYINEDRIKHWGIEDEYLAPIIKSPKEALKITLKSEDVQYKVFICSKTKKYLKRNKKYGALKYIEWGETRVSADGVPWSKVTSVSGRKLWYDLGERPHGRILLQMITNDRFFAPLNIDNIKVDHNLFEVFPKIDDYGLCIYLNSTLLALFRELISRVNLGDGATKTEGIDWKDILVPNEEILYSLSKKSKSFEALKNREINPIFEEVKMKDRQSLDSAVLEALGLDPKKYLKPLYDGVTGLVRERLELPKLRKNNKKAKTYRDVEKLKETVVNEILPQGVKIFPEGFVDSKYLKGACEISLPNKPLKLGSYFMGQQDVISEDGSFKYTALSVEEAKYIIYAQRQDSYIAAVPRETSVIINAVSDYERYLMELKGKLFEQLFTRTHNYNQSEQLVQQVFEEMGLPQV
ncbi:HsdM family class I SAM-dependent methyltransferase [Candidatus Magnetominusculus xianensis]|uniref:N-6 DNA methylase n=1 Tax=Candidatus Magnetominusculus xianensis TaxID=1748249 RepID=A0ABR5SFC8_9BACT|nr:N-6 DNA methylase [Candidatus Magnetominusculus xianensis]KWT83687.1 N-6 DNA methylase [Candidatus Magnetominusculus xianensis]MBF0402615.1 N-6 DNA methylase [Nitrospirota bacterium]